MNGIKINQLHVIEAAKKTVLKWRKTVGSRKKHRDLKLISVLSLTVTLYKTGISNRRVMFLRERFITMLQQSRHRWVPEKYFFLWLSPDIYLSDIFFHMKLTGSRILVIAG